jgi:hypothetical protein
MRHKKPGAKDFGDLDGEWVEIARLIGPVLKTLFELPGESFVPGEKQRKKQGDRFRVFFLPSQTAVVKGWQRSLEV